MKKGSKYASPYHPSTPEAEYVARWAGVVAERWEESYSSYKPVTLEKEMAKASDLVARALAAQLGTEHKTTAAPVAPAKVVSIAPVEGQKMYSEVFGYVPFMGDFPVSVLSGVDEKVARFVPSVDGDYVVQERECALLVAAIEDGDKALITGPTGSGKSSLVKYIAAKTGRPFIRINMSGDVQSDSIFGTLVVRGGATVWEDGAITEAVKYGALCLVDEWELMPAEIAMGLQNLLEDNGYLYLKEMPATSAERTIIPHKDFRIMFAGNTVGQGDTTGMFAGVGVQNTATIDRFTATVHLNYLSQEHEVNIITSKTKASKAVATQMVKLATLVRNAYNQRKLGLTMSPRTLINWGRKQERYELSYALKVAFLDKLSEEDGKAVEELYIKVFGK